MSILSIDRVKMASFTSSISAILFIALLSAHPVRGCGRADWAAARRRIISKVVASDNPKVWPGRLLRAGFHDCMPESCDGSIQFELDRRENGGISPTVEFLREARGDSCVTMSDMLKIGMVVSMQLSGGVRFRCPLGNRADATEANPAGQLPGLRDDAETMFEKLRNKGFTDRETLAGNFAGHSLGFFDLGKTPFTSRVSRYSNDFAKFVVGLPGTENSPRFASFNSLVTDVRLIEAERDMVELYSKNRRAMDLDFKSFMTKLCKF